MKILITLIIYSVTNNCWCLSKVPFDISISIIKSQSTPSQSTATVQTHDQSLIQKRLIYNEPLRFYKTKDMREHEEKSKMAVKIFWENLNNRPQKKQHSTSKASSRSTPSVLPAGTTSTGSNLQSAVIKTIVQPLAPGRLTASLNSARYIDTAFSKSVTSQSTSFQSAKTTTTQKIKLAHNNKTKRTKVLQDSSFTTADVQYKEPLKFYKTKDMREHEEKSKWVVQTFLENLNGRSKKLVQSNENTMESQFSTNVSIGISSTNLQTLSFRPGKEIPIRSTEQMNRIDKAICHSNKESYMSSKSTSKELIHVNEDKVTFTESNASSSGSTVQGEISLLDMDQQLTKVSNKRKYSGDGEIVNNKLVKITIPTTRKQKEFSTKINLPNKPAPQVHNIQNIVSSGSSKNNGVKSLVQLCTMTLVSNKHRLYKLGDTPYHLLEPILKFCTDEELRQLEKVNSRLINEDMELWKRFLQQKIPDQPLPDNPEDYRMIYLSIIDEEKEKKERIIGNLRRAMANEKAKKEARQVKMLPVAPREPKRKHSGYQKLTPLQKIRREMVREGYVMFPHRIFVY
ncbi:transcription elongation factor B polypeptide 3-like [Rhizophagus clarus]|uniref:Elongin-A n=1 Tax=Rhizophagus clarus TaxID=94130 RepID=A0A8H3R1I6_9GLOM|nr:transcription elongation factor B polypeptide 3-like [Rhizophagus clarus]